MRNLPNLHLISRVSRIIESQSKAVLIAVLLFMVFVVVRAPGWLRPQEREFAIVHQSRRYVPIGDFARGGESPDLINLHEYAILAAEVYGVNPGLTVRAKRFYPVADRDPEIVELRFNLTRGNTVTQHSMADLAKALDVVAQAR